MKLYHIKYDGQPDYVEAVTYGEAVAKWRAYVTAHDDVSADAEPESVTLIGDSDDYADRDFVVIR